MGLMDWDGSMVKIMIDNADGEAVLYSKLSNIVDNLLHVASDESTKVVQ